ncbi:MAG: RadC family protein [Lishizhenia sp.]
MNHSIKLWAEDDRPREKLLLKGKSSLSNSELMAILLGSGTRDKSAVDLAQEILNAQDNSLYSVGKMSVGELENFKGVGEAKAIKLIAAIELGRRRNTEPKPKPHAITTSKCAYDILKASFLDLSHEEFHIIALNRANHVIANLCVSKGGMFGTVADGKVIFKTLIDLKACGCILAHNHPSGNLKPSQQDLKLTKKMKEFGALIEICILDHLIFTDSGYLSFKDEGLL